MEFKGKPPANAAVVQGLAGIKRRGGAVLLIGGPAVGHTEVCTHFFESDEARSVLVRTEGTVDDVPHTGAPDAVIERPVTTRRTSTPTDSTPFEVLSLGREITSTMERVSGLDGDLRVCLHSLRPLIDRAPSHELAEFMTTIQTAARDNEGIVHIHLPAHISAVPDFLTEDVDAVVELTRRGQATYQQWRLPDADVVSDWLPV